MNYAHFEKNEIEGSIISRFKRVASLFPERVALQAETRRITYGDLDSATDMLARSIVYARGGGSEPVAFKVARPEEETIAILAILKAGKWYVPLSRKLPAAEVSGVLEKAGIGCVVTKEDEREFFKELDVAGLQILDFDGHERHPSDSAVQLLPETMAAAYFTSGSTGEPKGVLWDHRTVLHMAWINIGHFPIDMDDRHALIFSLTAAASGPCLFGTLLAGAALHIFDAAQGDLGTLEAWVREQRISIFYSPVSLLRKLLNERSGTFDLPDLRMVVVGGAPLFGSDVTKFREKFSDSARLVNRMAMSEVGGLTYYHIGADFKTSDNIVPVGYPVEDKEICLVDGSGKPVKDGKIGEIVVKSRFLSSGYLGDDELTAARFKPGSDGDGSRVFLTGDLGRMLSDGCLLHMGRKDFALKIRGYRVELGAVERAINDLDTIRECAVVACNQTGGDEKYLAAYFTASTTKPPTQADLRQRLAETLPEYMIPSIFVQLETFPLTHTGKIDRTALPEPNRTRPDVGRAYRGPHSTAEVTLVGMFEETLDMSGIGIDDDFFDLGGNSLQAMELHQKVEMGFIIQIPIQTLFNDATVAGMSACIDAHRMTKGGGGSCRDALLPLRSNGTKAAFFLIHGKNGQAFASPHFLKILGSEQPVYAFQASGLNRSWHRFPSIRKMAVQYIAAMREVQPEGPYFLGSTCAGSVVSIEMAHQLIEQGEQVRPLIMIDPPLRIRRKNSGIARLRHYYNLMRHRRLLYEEWEKRFDMRSKEGRIQLDSSDAEAILAATSSALSFDLALKTYSIPPYDGKVLMLSSRERLSRGLEYAKKYLTGELQTCEVCSLHLEIHEPDNEVFAREIKKCMEISLRD